MDPLVFESLVVLDLLHDHLSNLDNAHILVVVGLPRKVDLVWRAIGTRKLAYIIEIGVFDQFVNCRPQKRIKSQHSLQKIGGFRRTARIEVSKVWSCARRILLQIVDGFLVSDEAHFVVSWRSHQVENVFELVIFARDRNTVVIQLDTLVWGEGETRLAREETRSVFSLGTVCLYG